MEAKVRAYVEGLLARGRRTFTREDAEVAERLDSRPLTRWKNGALFDAAISQAQGRSVPISGRIRVISGRNQPRAANRACGPLRPRETVGLPVKRSLSRACARAASNF